MVKKAAGLVIFRSIENTIQYLLMKASYGNLHWTPPKGHVDPGETDWVTALRETREESSLVEDDLVIYKDVSQTLYYPVEGNPKEVKYWLAQLKNPATEIKLSKEHTEFRWLELEEAMKFSGYKDFNEMLLNFDMRVNQILHEVS